MQFYLPQESMLQPFNNEIIVTFVCGDITALLNWKN